MDIAPRDEGEAAAERQRERLHEACAAAALFYHNLLLRSSAEGAQGGARLCRRTRGLTEATIARFMVGYAPDSWDATATYLRERGFSNAELLEAGLIIEREGDRRGLFRPLPPPPDVPDPRRAGPRHRLRRARARRPAAEVHELAADDDLRQERDALRHRPGHGGDQDLAHGRDRRGLHGRAGRAPDGPRQRGRRFRHGADRQAGGDPQEAARGASCSRSTRIPRATWRR